MSSDLRAGVEGALTRTPEISWGVSVLAGDGRTLLRYADDRRLCTASVGKVLLLVEVARRFALDATLPGRRVHRSDATQVADSGLWQHLQIAELPMVDAAVLVASVSDNWATNLLLDEVGLDAVRATAESLDLAQTRLLDRVRDRRAASDIDQLSVGTAAELSRLMQRLYRGDLLTPEVAATVRRWMSLNVDLSMVASAWGLDPLAHSGQTPVTLFNKTGWDAGVRAEIGVLAGPGDAVAYAVLANWSSDDPHLGTAAQAAMRVIGERLGAFVGHG